MLKHIPKNRFTFEISLSVLDHLGRNLYRSFATVLGEAISNAWDADAENVHIYIDRERGSFLIKDDGTGMTAEDFQAKFLKIGYSKRKEGGKKSRTGRPYIGRKGIGKLALLSCADKITVISKIDGGEYDGGTIDNSALDAAITEDLTPQEYPLELWNTNLFDSYTINHEQGTIIHFENVREGIRNSLDFLKKIIALYFRFSLVDASFNIFINDEKITLDHLKDLAQRTQFLWNINGLSDPYIDETLNNLTEEPTQTSMDGEVKGFIASVNKPRDLKIATTDDRAGVDLFVNGRLRERDILKHIPTARVAENYFYGQIHFDGLDDDKDRFTSSREGIVADDPKYREFLDNLRKQVLEIISTWDKLRIKNRNDGDPENEKVPPKQRKSLELYNAVSEEYELPLTSDNKEKVEGWVSELGEDAAFNFGSYADCFISENLVRKYIHERNFIVSTEAQNEIDQYKEHEKQHKEEANINIDIRRNNDDLSYLDMLSLVHQADRSGVQNTLVVDAKEYRPIRNAVAHTAVLSTEAKAKLTTVYNNIKARIRNLLSDESNS